MEKKNEFKLMRKTTLQICRIKTYAREVIATCSLISESPESSSVFRSGGGAFISELLISLLSALDSCVLRYKKYKRRTILGQFTCKLWQYNRYQRYRYKRIELTSPFNP